MRYRSTIAGSLPKPPWLAEPERLWPRFLHEGEALAEAQRDATTLAVFGQSRCGIDCPTDGEMGRVHFVHGFLERLGGIDRENKVRRGIRNDRYEADCPQIVGPVTRPASVHAADVAAARAATGGHLKFTLPGSMTIVDTLYDAHYRDRKTAAFAFADLLNAEMRDLIAAGADVIQLDEPAFNVFFNEVEDWGIAAVDRAFAGIDARRAIHVCYGYGIDANNKWKAELGAEWDQYAHILPLIAQSCVHEISIELAGSRVPAHVLAHAAGKDVAVGAIDVASDVVETAAEVCATLERAAEFVPRERIIASTNCGMAPMKREIAWAKLAALGAGAAAFAAAGQDGTSAYGADDSLAARVG